jgi:NAD(P)-dependent dehydrogenase (short-subunit alcohol dehydrogenase family)
MFDLTGQRVLVAGHNGMDGSEIVRLLASEDCAILASGRKDVDLCDGLEGTKRGHLPGSADGTMRND